jgi:DNA modification methylase
MTAVSTLSSSTLTGPWAETLADSWLYRGDALHALAAVLPADSVQLVVTSPPYNVAWHYGDGGDADRRPLAAYLAMLAQALAGCYRVLRPGGVLALNLPPSIRTPEHRAYPLAAWAPLQLATDGWLLREPLAWVKARSDGTAYSPGTAFGGPRNPYLRPCHELVLVASKGQYQMPANDTCQWRDGAAAEWGSYLEWCKDVWHLPPGRCKRGEPLAFPDALPARLIALYSAPGDVVLDPFAGTGTTGRVALALGRRAWLIERESTYWPRLEAMLSQSCSARPLETAL